MDTESSAGHELSQGTALLEVDASPGPSLFRGEGAFVPTDWSASGTPCLPPGQLKHGCSPIFRRHFSLSPLNNLICTPLGLCTLSG